MDDVAVRIVLLKLAVVAVESYGCEPYVNKDRNLYSSRLYYP